MRLNISHKTTHHYADPPVFSAQVIRLTPRNNASQHVIRWRIEPSDGLSSWTDAFGNVCHTLVVDEPRERIEILASGEVDTVDLGGVLPREVGELPLEVFLRQTDQTKPGAALRDFARGFSDSLNKDRVSGLHELMNAVRDHVEYETGTTDALATAGNLATSQAVVSMLSERLGDPHGENGIMAADSMFAVAQIVGNTLSQVIGEHGEGVREEGGDPGSTFILGGQIDGRSPRLFLIYAAGNFIEATHETPFLQIGENKYGKPILDRTVSFDMSIDRAVKAALVSFDSTMRSNLSVGPPIDLITIQAGKQRVERHVVIEEDDPYFTALRQQYGAGIVSVFDGLPEPDISEWPKGPSC